MCLAAPVGGWGPRSPQKSWVLVYWATAISKISFTKNHGERPPLKSKLRGCIQVGKTPTTTLYYLFGYTGGGGGGGGGGVRCQVSDITSTKCTFGYFSIDTPTPLRY